MRPLLSAILLLILCSAPAVALDAPKVGGYVNDQAGVQAAVQRLRLQAQSVGNLESSEHMEVTNETQDAQQTVTIQPAEPEVIYVPQYDPEAAYAPPATTTYASTTSTATTINEGYSTGDMIATGLLAFGAGIIVKEIFDDDDWHDHHRYGWHRPMPHYPRYRYQPHYGGGFYPHHNYNRPNNYVRNNVVVVNQHNNYFNRFDTRNSYKKSRPVNSPVTAASPGPAVKGAYAGAQPSTRSQSGPKVQGSYAGANRTATNYKDRDAGRPAVGVSGAATSASGRKSNDRGYKYAGADSKNNVVGGSGQQKKRSVTAFSGTKDVNAGDRTRAASSQGRASGSGKDLKAQYRANRG